MSNNFEFRTHTRKAINDFVDELLKKGCITPSKSPYNSPIFAVKKKDGSLRCVLDYRMINLHSQEDKYVIRSVQQSIDEIGKNKSTIFTCADLSSSFWQQELEPRSRPMTAFSLAGRGRFEWVVTPMGLKGSPASFSRLMDHVMAGLNGVITYIDDLLIHAKNHDEHIDILNQCFGRLRKFGLKLRIEKCIFGAKEVTYLGFRLTPAGIKPGLEKMEAVRQMSPPDTIRRVREFCGLTNYFRILVQNFATKIAPLSKLTRKDSTWKRGPLPEDALQAFEQIKNDLTSEPVVTYPNPDLQFILATDAACGDDTYDGGLGAILQQRQPDGTERVIAYASRGLKDHEKNYSPYLLELAAASWAIDHFHVYLYGSKQFILRTDHKPLETLSKIHKKTLNRLQLQMLEYNFRIEYRAGKDNAGPDALSRNAIISAMNLTNQEALKLQMADPLIHAIFKFIDHATPVITKPLEPLVIQLAPFCNIGEDGLLYFTIRYPMKPPQEVLFRSGSNEIRNHQSSTHIILRRTSWNPRNESQDRELLFLARHVRRNHQIHLHMSHLPTRKITRSKQSPDQFMVNTGSSKR